MGGPPTALQVISFVFLIAGVTIWIWSVALILTKVPQGELIMSGPYDLMKHPLYTSVALLVLPWVGFLLNTWLGALIGVACTRIQDLRSRGRGITVEDLRRAVGRVLQFGEDAVAVNDKPSPLVAGAGSSTDTARRGHLQTRDLSCNQGKAGN